MIDETERVPMAFAITRQAQMKNFIAVAPQSAGLYINHGRPLDGRARKALSIAAFYGGTRFLSETLAGLPKRINQAVTDATGQTKRKTVNHYATPLISQKPNALVNALYLWETCYGHAVMYGNGYIWIDRRLGKVVGLHNLHSLQVIPFRSEGQQWYTLRNWNGTPVRDVLGGPIRIPSADMIHIRNWSEDGEIGVSVLDVLAEDLGLAKRLSDFLVKYFDEGSATNIVVEMDQPKEGKLTKDDVALMRSSLDAYNKGADNAHNMLVIAGATAKSLTPPIKDFAYDILKAASVDDIANALRIDPTMLYNLQKATWANLEQLGMSLVNYSLGNWVRKTEIEVNNKLLTDDERAQGFYCKIQTEHLTRGSYADRVEAGAKGMASGLFNSDEWREGEGYDARPGGDVYYSPQNAPPSGKGDGWTPDLDGEDDDDTQPTPPASSDPVGSSADTTPADAVDATAAALPTTVMSRGDQLDRRPAKGEQLRQLFGRFLTDAAERVRRKQAKAFGRDRDDEWCHKFAPEIANDLAENLNPFVETVFTDPTDRSFALQSVIEEYTAAVNKNGKDADPEKIIDQLIMRVK